MEGVFLHEIERVENWLEKVGRGGRNIEQAKQSKLTYAGVLK
jgi:hypothetical protein